MSDVQDYKSSLSDPGSRKFETFSYLPTMEAVEKAYIYWVLKSEGWKKQRAAEILGIDPSTLHRKIERYQLPREGKE